MKSLAKLILVLGFLLLVGAGTVSAQQESNFTNGASYACSQWPLANGSLELVCSGIPVTLAGTPDGYLTVYEFTAYTDANGYHPPVGTLTFAKADGEVYTSTNWNYETDGWEVNPAGDDSYTATSASGKQISGYAHETIHTQTYCWNK